MGAQSIRYNNDKSMVESRLLDLKDMDSSDRSASITKSIEAKQVFTLNAGSPVDRHFELS